MLHSGPVTDERADLPPFPEPVPAPPVVPTSARRRRARLTALVEVVCASGLPSQITIAGLLMLAGLSPLGPDGQLSLTYVATLLAGDTVVLLAFVAWRLQAGGERVSDVLLGSTPGRSADVWLGVALVPALYGGVSAVLALVRWLVPWLHNVPTNPFESLARAPYGVLVLGILVVLSGGLKEEVQRVFVLRRFEQHLGGAPLGLAIYSVVFGLGHFAQGYDVGVMTTIMGVAWGLVILRRRNIVAASISHAGFNAAQILQFVLVGR
jgi:membrane protease YdiL (CAAX protease family)